MWTRQQFRHSHRLVGQRLSRVALVAWLTMSTPAASAAPPPCDRMCLVSESEAILNALIAHDLPRLAFAPAARATLNGESAPPDDPRWQAIDGVAYRQFAADPETGQVAVFGVAEESGRRGTLFARLKVAASRIVELEVVLGEKTPDGVPGLLSPNPLFDYVLPLPQRRSRDRLLAIAQSYADGLQAHDGGRVPVSSDCRRFEDGYQTANSPYSAGRLCNDFHMTGYMDRISHRRFPVVDVARGLVLAALTIEVSTPRGPGSEQPRRPISPISGIALPSSPMLAKPRFTLIQALFKIIDGRITEMQIVRFDRAYGQGGGW